MCLLDGQWIWCFSGSISSRRPPPEVLIPAVEAWLKHPFGKSANGESLSMALISLLAEEVRSEEELRQDAVRKLSGDLDALHIGAQGRAFLGKGKLAS